MSLKCYFSPLNNFNFFLQNDIAEKQGVAHKTIVGGGGGGGEGMGRKGVLHRGFQVKITVKRTQPRPSNLFFSQSQENKAQNKRSGVRSSAVMFATYCDWSAGEGSPILLFETCLVKNVGWPRLSSFHCKKESFQL